MTTAIKIPYPLIPAVSLEDRHAQMFHAIQLGFARLQGQPARSSARPLSIACYGPSLEQTWQSLAPPILSMSGATRFLADRGVTPDFHIDMDPRAHKAKHLDPPIANVEYWMASVCPPASWSLLRDQSVKLWHLYSGKNDKGQSTYDWVRRHDPGVLTIRGGSTIGLTALHLGWALGYSRFEIHGMDGSFADETRASRHAGPHYGHVQGTAAKDHITWAVEGVTYHTSKIMANAVAETRRVLQNFPYQCIFHGSGLTQALVREDDPPSAAHVSQTDKTLRLRAAGAQPTSTEYWEALLAETSPAAWLTQLLAQLAPLAARRAAAKYNTGTIGAETAMQLRALCLRHQPRAIIEIGTFIGSSAEAMRVNSVGSIYTCDRDNDCVPADGVLRPHPFHTSTEMLTKLAASPVEDADFVFVDGRLTDEDLPLLTQCTTPTTVYAFDDYHEGPTGKGLANVTKLSPVLTNHRLVAPYPAFAGRSTLALLVPLAGAA